MAEGRVLFDAISEKFAHLKERSDIGKNFIADVRSQYDKYLNPGSENLHSLPASEGPQIDMPGLDSWESLFGLEPQKQKDIHGWWNDSYYQPPKIQPNESRFLSPQQINEMADIYERYQRPGGHLFQYLPEQMRNTAVHHEDFGAVTLSNDIDHVLEQTYKEKIAKDLDVPDYHLSIDRYDQVRAPSYINIDTNEIRPFGGDISRQRGEVLAIPKSMIADEFATNPSLFLRSVNEHNKFVNEGIQADVDAILGYGRELADQAKARTPEGRRAGFKVVGRDLFKDDNTIKALLPAATGLGILGTGLSSQDALALPTNDAQGNPIADAGAITNVEHPYLDAAANAIDKYAVTPIPLMEHPLSGVSNELRNFGRDRPAGQRLEDAMGAVSDFAGLPENIAAGLYSAGRVLFNDAQQ